MTDEKIQRAIEGYTVAKKGYKPTNGNLATSRPPKGGSGMEPPPAQSSDSGSSSDSGQSQSAND
jgi:hypothetical protein